MGVLLVLLIACSSCYARDLGVIGKTYEIAEEDLIQVMKNRVLEKQKNGELEKEMNEFRKRAENKIKRPKGVKLPKANIYTIKSLSLVYRLPNSIVDANGRVLYQAGTTVNPLQIKTLSKEICFFDGDDQKQVEWVLKTCGENPLNKMIMTSGDFIELSNKYQRRFYFDQNGVFVNRLDIEQLPARVKQKGDLLYVEEFPI